MAFNLASIQKSTGIKAPRVLIYGSHGLGKTTFGAGAPNPIFILTEDGLGSIKSEHFPLATAFQHVLDAISSLYSEDHKFQTVVLDSLDWLDNLIWTDINAKHDQKDLAYGKGAMIAAEYWRNVLEGLNALRDSKNMAVILIAHSEIKRFDSPEVEPYDRYQPKLQARSSALVQEWCDAVLFANFKTIVKKDDVGFNKTVSRGITTGERLIYTTEKPAYLAKNRFGLPESIPLEWSAFAEAIAL
ncbi:ATP-binding protein [Polynucleobacter sp. UB-Piko-W3]|uniref:ATP-binding protein n=1 Tax=Polynucleobacter sp. UB-Piko-W3 TaxID=1819735 RepID=UPI001C0AC1DC|nr:ATP-binding protein [Polynucleobacter sp. UB-Piko-W3]MBU3554850.1 ATP-binding protein [Polynucleobacter sp. UB-Piko-W3]